MFTRVKKSFFVCLIIVSNLVFVATPASADTVFGPIFSTNSPGDIAYVSNTVATCNATVATCAAAQAGGSSTNNGFGANMVLVDVDGDPTTATSSTASYTLPTGGSVLWAGLYWAGYYTGPNGDKDDVKFSTPASGGYVNLTATWFDDWNSNDNYYTGFVDVTTLVNAGGSGQYGVGDIAVTPGSGATYGGWTLIVVEEDPAEPWRNLTVNHGFQLIGGGAVVPINISGFTAPPVGPINAEVGIVASEGDIGFTGDYAQLNGVTLSNATNPANNFFNSSITDNGVYNGGMNPSYPANTLGFDADIINTTGLIAPNSTSATVTIGTNGDGFFPTAVTTAIEIYVPNLTANLTKTATDLNGEDLHPGDIIEYTIFFDNSGDDPAIETQVSDAIPAGTTYVPNSLEVIQDDNPLGSKTDAAGDDTAWFDGSAVNFNIGTGATATTGGEVIPTSQGGRGYEVSFQVQVDAGTEGSDITNEADIDYIAEFLNEPFSTTSNETSQPVEALVDLAIDKKDLSDPIFAGDQLTYELDVDNAGPSPATSVVITDSLPFGTTFNASLSDPACSAVGLTVTCSYASIAAGGSVAPQIVVDVDGDLDVNICNGADVTSATHEHNVKDNTDKECTEIEREVDLDITKTAPATATAGDQFTYNITIDNDGPSDAQNVVVGDALPAGLTLVSATPSGAGTCSGSLTCTWPELEAGDSETITLVVAVPAGTADGTVFTNKVKTSSDDPETNTANNTDDVETEIVTEANLALTKNTNTDPVVAGESVSYTLEATNNGPSDALNVVVSDTVPTGTTFNASLSSAGCTILGVTVTCPVGTLADGASASFTLVFDIDSSVPHNTSLVNEAVVTTTTDDPDEDDNEASVINTVIRQADLSVIKDDNTTTVDAGGQITYTLSYQNNGPSDATGVTITDTIPTGATFSSSSDCTASGATVTCAIGTVADGASGSVSFIVDTDPSLLDTAQLTNVASISGNEDDPVSTNDDTKVSTDINRTTELKIEKDDLADPVLAGETVTYSIEVTNLGPSTDDNVTITDALPTGLTFVSTDDPTNCSNAANTVTCAAGTLLPNAVYSVEITATVDAALADGTILENKAEADGDFSPLVDDTEETTIRTSADLAITKTAPTTATAGNQITYALEIENNGPSDAQNVVISDTLPVGVTYDSHSITAGSATCSASGAAFSCTTPTLADQGTITVEVTVTIDEALANNTTLTNKADVKSDTLDPTSTNDGDTADTLATKSADLAVEKVTIGGPFLAGEQATFEVTVTNNGPSSATGVSVTDTLPTGFTFNAANSDTTCAAGVTCTAGTILAGDSVTFTIVADIAAATTAGDYTNTATASGNETDPDEDNDEGTSVAPISATADLAIKKVSDEAVFTPGTTETYTIEVTNDGPSNAVATVVTDTLPAGLTFDSAGSDSACSASGQTVTCALGTLTPNQVVSFTLSVAIDASFTGNVTNEAGVSSDTFDPDDSDNASEDITATLPAADLSLEKTADADAVAGETLTYDFVVTNDGPSDAVAVVATDVLPAGLTFTATGSDAACSASGQTVTCALGTLTPGQSVSYSVAVDIDGDVAHTTDLVNDASVSSDTHDPDVSNNNGEAETTISKETDVSIVKTASAETVTAGTNFTYTLVVENAGPSDANNIVVADTLPAGISATAVTTDLGLCGNFSTSFGCSFGSMTPSDVMTITVTAFVDESVADDSVLKNTATVETSDPDTDEENNTSAVDVTVDAKADLSIEKVAAAESVIAGEPISYTVTVTNDGPSDAQNVEVLDTLPTSLHTIAATSADFTCSVSGQLVDCDLATLADGATAEITITAVVDEDSADDSTISNTAMVSSATDDPDEDNNSSLEETNVTKSVDLALEKTTTKPIAVAGETHPYQLSVTNDGPSSATGVVITDTLPTGTTFNATLSDAACSASGTTVTCLITSIADGTTVDLNLVIDVPADYVDGSSITNSADVDSNEADSDEDNNDSSVTTDVENSADLAVVKDADGTAIAGEPYSWTLAVDNYGPSDAIGVVVTDTLPAGTTFDASASDIRCSAVGQVVTCVLGTMAPDTDDSLTIGVQVDSAVAANADLENTASIASDTDDPNDENNESSDTAGVTRESELDITKSDVVDPVVAGEQVSWQIKVDNLGPSDAANVTISDTLPAGTSFVSVDNTTDCSHSGGVISCLFASIADGSSETIIITADLDTSLADATVIENTATANSDSSDEVSDEETTTLNRRSDLSLVKSSDEAAVAGTQHTYTIAVTNDGPSDADNVVVTDYLPAGVNYVSSTNSGCSAVGALVTCNLGTMADEAVISFDIVVFVTDAAESSAKNVAEVASDSVDPNEENNTDDDITAVSFQADLALTKSFVTDPVVPGENVVWELTVTNNGPSIANNVTVTDTLATGFTFVSGPGTDSSPTCSAVGQVVTCSEADLVANETVTFLIETASDSDLLGEVSNAASVDADTPDPDEENNSTEVSDTVAPQADLSLTKVATTEAATAGENISYTLTVSNAGPSDAQNIVINDVLPANTTFVPAMSSSTCVLADAAFAGAQVDCVIPVVPNGESVDVTLTLLLGTDYEAGETLTNEASVDADTPDPDEENNSSKDETPVETSADLFVVKSGPSETVDAGTNYTYQIEVENTGSSDAQNVTLTDILPTGTTFVSVNDTACSHAGGTLSCAFGTITAYDSVIIEITVLSDQGLAEGNVVTNNVTVTSDTFDPNEDNNSDSQETTITREAYLLMTKTASSNTIIAGEAFTYYLTVQNQGPSATNNVVITDVLPTGLSVVSLDPDCVDSAGTLTCSAGTMNINDERTFEVVVLADSALAQEASLVNEATATGDDAVSSTEAEEITVETQANLTIEKTLNTELAAGEKATYTLAISNTGSSDAQEVVVSDALPAGVSYVSDSAGCDVTGSLLTCNVGTLANAASSAVEVTVFVEPFVTDEFELANHGAVLSNTQDPDPSDNGVSDEEGSIPFGVDAVVRSVELSINKSLVGESIDAGGQSVWAIEVTNNGPATATDVAITDSLPSGLSFVSATLTQDSVASNVSCSTGSDVVCPVGSLAVGSTAELTITTDVAAETPSTITNVASAQSNETQAEAVASAGASVNPVAVERTGLLGNLPLTGSQSLRLAIAAGTILAAGLLLRRRAAEV